MDAIARTLSRIKYRTEGTPFHVILLVGKGTQGHCHPLTVFPSLMTKAISKRLRWWLLLYEKKYPTPCIILPLC